MAKEKYTWYNHSGAFKESIDNEHQSRNAPKPGVMGGIDHLPKKRDTVFPTKIQHKWYSPLKTAVINTK